MLGVGVPSLLSLKRHLPLFDAKVLGLHIQGPPETKGDLVLTSLTKRTWWSLATMASLNDLTSLLGSGKWRWWSLCLTA